MAFALASFIHWRHEVEQMVYQAAAGVARWGKAGSAFLVLLILAIAGLVLLYAVSWMARRLVAPGLGCTFDKLTPEQKRFLGAQFMSGLRRVEVPLITTRQRWFEGLVSLRYMERREIPLQPGQTRPYDLPGTMPFEVTAAGWRELRRNLAGNGTTAGRGLGTGAAGW
jgi:hypothetical protein